METRRRKKMNRRTYTDAKTGVSDSTDRQEVELVGTRSRNAEG